MIVKAFGKQPSGDRRKRIGESPNYKDDQFQNLHPTPIMAEDSNLWKTMLAFASKPGDTRPANALPFIKTDLKLDHPGEDRIIWFGHSSYLIQLKGLTILVDPVFNNHASPFKFMVKAFPGADQYAVSDLPDIDILVQTHDHYDHLAYESIVELLPKVKRVVTSLGVGSHFEYWGYDPRIITELDWWETTTLADEIALTATPARHFSGRGLTRGKTLWASFVLQTSTRRIFIGGDSGYDSHFKDIGARYGPFYIALLECGQYNKHWKYIHMMPEETVQAAQDLNAQLLLPVHWAKFTLALHPWKDPIERVVKQAAIMKQPITTPMIGEPVIFGGSYPTQHWWQTLQ